MQVDLLCVAVAVFTLLLGYVLGWLGGHAVGRYKGEKGRRLAAEAYLVMGAPNARPAARKVALKNAPALEPEVAPQGFDQATLERGAEEIMEQAKAAGAPVSRDQAIAMAGDMLTHALQGGGVEDDINLG